MKRMWLRAWADPVSQLSCLIDYKWKSSSSAVLPQLLHCRYLCTTLVDRTGINNHLALSTDSDLL